MMTRERERASRYKQTTRFADHEGLISLCHPPLPFMQTFIHLLHLFVFVYYLNTHFLSVCVVAAAVCCPFVCSIAVLTVILRCCHCFKSNQL